MKAWYSTGNINIRRQFNFSTNSDKKMRALQSSKLHKKQDEERTEEPDGFESYEYTSDHFIKRPDFEYLVNPSDPRIGTTMKSYLGMHNQLTRHRKQTTTRRKLGTGKLLKIEGIDDRSMKTKNGRNNGTRLRWPRTGICPACVHETRERRTNVGEDDAIFVEACPKDDRSSSRISDEQQMSSVWMTSEYSYVTHTDRQGKQTFSCPDIGKKCFFANSSSSSRFLSYTDLQLPVYKTYSVQDNGVRMSRELTATLKVSSNTPQDHLIKYKLRMYFSHYPLSHPMRLGVWNIRYLVFKVFL
ncbi:hypothetical protein CLF_108852 [Clonorchis sinensis]|uniref:Uncharacterized protein n=1 Tax=Clonorchis sinensis TaxID=79923 RepID=G7YS01_CLOSI|nr:hypothetical protein CLF_108852 [Clonorchis sinensis]